MKKMKYMMFWRPFIKKNVPTAMKRKITAVYKEKPSKDIKDAVKKTYKVKKPTVKKSKVEVT